MNFSSSFFCLTAAWLATLLRCLQATGTGQASELWCCLPVGEALERGLCKRGAMLLRTVKAVEGYLYFSPVLRSFVCKKVGR